MQLFANELYISTNNNITMEDILAQLDTILSARFVDAKSMQVFDAIALSAKSDKQLRKLADYIVSNGPIQLDIDCAVSGLTTRLVNGEIFATINVDNQAGRSIVTIAFAKRVPWQARAWNKDDVSTTYEATCTGNTITITQVQANTITVQFF